MRKEVFIHIIIWLIYIGYAQIDIYLNTPDYFHFWEFMLTYALLASVFYFGSFVTFGIFYRKRKFFLFVVVLLASWVLFLVLNYVIEGIFAVWHYGASPLTDLSFTGYVMPASWFFIQFSLFAFGFFYAKLAVRRERELRISEKQALHLAAQNTLLQKQKLEFENAFLRAQINPHFLYNTLSFVYNEVEPYSPTAAEVIDRFTELMRNSLQMPDEQGLIALSDEVNAVTHLVAIHKIRFPQGHINFTSSGHAGQYRIIPAVLLTLAENTFKHGSMTDPESPISINISISNQTLSFSTHNKKTTRIKDDSNSLGVANIRQRLQQVYPNNHSFVITDEPLFYTCTLTITLC
jgi:sensor histidine kinase YesM